jgi:hypothetical protein
MDELSSTEFRKTFARLTVRTVVTVNGHVIGEWVPIVPADFTASLGKALGLTPDQRVVMDTRPVTSRPFTPAPKPSQKGK